MTKLFWDNLKDNLCPQCGKGLLISPRTAMHYCTSEGCQFRVSDVRFQEIVHGKVKRSKEKKAPIGIDMPLEDIFK